MQTHKVRLPNGKIARVKAPEGASIEAITAYAQQQYESEQPQGIARNIQEATQNASLLGDLIPELRTTEEIKDRALQLAQGPLLGLAEEVGSAVRASPALLDNRNFNEEYKRFFNPTRKRQKQFRKQNPIESTALNAIGGLALGVVPAAASIARSVSQPILSTVARSFFGGAAMGGATGFGEGEGGFINRLSSALPASIIGAGLGAIATAAPSLVRAGARVFQGPETKAARRAAQTLTQQGISAPTARAQLAELGPEGMVADVSGNAARELAAIRRARPDLEDAIKLPFSKRAQREPQRVAQSISKYVSGNDFQDTTKNIAQARKVFAQQDYNKAYDVKLPDSLEEMQNIRNIVDRKPIKNILRDFDEELSIIGEQRPPNIDINEAGEIIIGGDLDTRTIDYVKRALDTAIENQTDSVTGKISSKGRNFLQVKRDLLDNIDAINPAYKDARNKYAGFSALDNALQKGRKGLSLDKEEITEFLAGSSDSEKDMFLIGFARQLDERAARSTREASAFNRRDVREKIAAAIGNDDAAEKFLNALETEKTFTQTRGTVTAGSPTAQAQTDRVSIGGLQKLFQPDGIRLLMGETVEELMPQNQAVQEALARLYTQGQSGLGQISRQMTAQERFARGLSGLGNISTFTAAPTAVRPTNKGE